MLALSDCHALTRKCKIQSSPAVRAGISNLARLAAVLALQLCQLLQQLWQLYTK